MMGERKGLVWFNRVGRGILYVFLAILVFIQPFFGHTAGQAAPLKHSAVFQNEGLFNDSGDSLPDSADVGVYASFQSGAAATGELVVMQDSRWSLKAPADGYIEVIDVTGNRKYRGTLTLANNEAGIQLINRVNLHDYLLGVVPYESLASWPVDVLKAQAVAARTFVQGRGYRVVDTDRDQTYRGIYESSYASKVREAVSDSDGEMLYHDGRPIRDAVYSAANGGVREESRYAFSNGHGPELAYLPGGKDVFILDGEEIIPEEHGRGANVPSPEYRWERVIETSVIEEKWPEVGRLEAIDIISRTPQGKGILELALHGSKTSEDKPLIVPGYEFRQKLGSGIVRSSYILAVEVLEEQKQVKVTGGGYGHRAGMSQWGAAGLAHLGVKYQEILSHYYPGTTLEKTVHDREQMVEVNLWAGAGRAEWTIRPSHDIAVVNQDARTVKTLQAGELYRIGMGVDVDRISGENRYHTAAEISGKWNRADTVILARGDQFADALAGVPLAYKHGAPVLLTQPDHLPEVIKQELKRLNTSKVILLGGAAAIAESVETELVQELGLAVERIEGENRFDTARLIAEEVGASTREAVIVNGLNFPDAFSVATYAARHGYPILLSQTDEVPEETLEALTALNINRTYLIGGEVAVDHAVEQELKNEHNVTVERISGNNRYGTNVAVIQRFGGLDQHFYVATGAHFADALAGAALAAREGTGIVLVGENIQDETRAYLQQASLSDLTVLGGTQAVSDEAALMLLNLLP